MCDAIPAAIGGCDPVQPAFTATNCADLGRQFGQEVSKRLQTVIDGPEVVNGEAKSARMTSVQLLVIGRTRQYLERAGGPRCTVDDLVSGIRSAVPPTLKDAAAKAWWGFNPGTFDTWLDQVAPMIDRVIVQPPLPASPGSA